MAEDYSDDPSSGADEAAGEIIPNDDGSVTVQVAPPPEDLPDEAFNLVPHFSGTEAGKKYLKKVADKVVRDFDDDWESCADWRKKRKERWQLLVGDLPNKTFPFEGCANAHVPIMLERVLRVVHRLYGEMFPDREYIFTAVAANALAAERAEILTKHSNWQFRKDIPDFFKQNRRAMMEFIANGDAVMWSYRDIPGKRNCHEALSCEEICWPYHFKTTRVDMGDIPRKTRILRKYKHELRELERAGVYANVAELFAKLKDPGFDDGPELEVRPAVDKFEGREPSSGDKDAPFTLYEYHGWCTLPGAVEERPVVVVVEERTRIVLCMYLREDDDWKDRIRFETEQGEFIAYNEAQSMHAEMQAREQEVMARLNAGDLDPAEAVPVQEALMAGAPPPPQPPKWLKPGAEGPEPARRVPIEYGSHGVCIENLDGSLGLGIGLLLEEFNRAADTTFSQFIDAATLANAPPILAPESLRIEGGARRLKPGEITRVRGSIDLDKAFKVIPFQPANGQLLEVVRMSTEAADGVSSAPDVLSGEPGKSNETYRGLATRVEQATRQLTVLAMNYLEMLTNVVKNNCRLNSVFLPDEEIRHVVDPRTLEGSEIRVDRSLYAEDYDIVFSADTRFAGREQKIAEADQLLSMVTALPPPISQMIFPPSYIYAAVVRSLKARGAHDMIRFLGPAPPTPTERPQPAPPPGAPGLPPGAPPGPPGLPPAQNQPQGPGGPAPGPPPARPPAPPPSA